MPSISILSVRNGMSGHVKKVTPLNKEHELAPTAPEIECKSIAYHYTVKGELIIQAFLLYAYFETIVSCLHNA